MSYNIRRNTRTKTQTTEWPAEKHFESVEDITVCGTDDVFAFLIKLLEQHNVSCSRLKTCIKFKTSTEKYDDIEKQLRQKFPVESEIQNCPICKTELTKIPNTPIFSDDGVRLEGAEYDYECPKYDKKFELLSMETKLDKHGNTKRSYTLRGEVRVRTIS